MTTINARQVGDRGERIVFLHGLFGQGKNFASAAKALQPEFTSLLVDLPNHGRSAWTERVDYVEMADAVADALRQGFAADGPVNLVGHSMGGKVAMALALRHPDLVARLVVADISPAASDGAEEFEHLLGSLMSLDLSTVNRRGEADERLQDLIPSRTVRGFLLQNLRADDDGGYEWQANLTVLHRDLPAISRFPSIEASFDGPVLWIRGELSTYVQDKHQPAMRALFPRTRRVTIKNAGHWVHSEQPQAFVSALREFLGQAEHGPEVNG